MPLPTLVLRRMREAAIEPRDPSWGEILLPTNRVLIYDTSHLSECDL